MTQYRRARGDRGFTLSSCSSSCSSSGIAIPVFLNQRDKAARGATRATMRNFATEIYAARENARLPLRLITNNGCSACECRDDPQAPMPVTHPSFPASRCGQQWTTTASRLAAAAGTSATAMQALMVDGWGYPLMPDENEGEVAACGTSTDALFSGGKNHKIGLFPADPDDITYNITAGGCTF